jgi:Zn-dependent protease with chaperone function
MFAARGVAVSFSVFLIVYCVLSLAVSLAWRTLWMIGQGHSLRRVADALFALRMFPLLAATTITAVFAVPSFLLLEPRAIDEPLGGIPLTLGVCGVGLGIFGLLHAAIALRRASRTIARWTSAAQLVESSAPVPVLRGSGTIPAMTAAGIVRPRVLLSSAVESMLTANELRTALNHEFAHLHRRDNLKKLLFRFVAFPGMSGLEAAWLQATEMAADDAAVANAGEALDLAAALIKLSRLSPVEPPADLTAALVYSPGAVMNARVERLIAWSDEVPASTRRFFAWYALGAAAATVAISAVTYAQLLVSVHAATEWLVR